MKITSLVTFIGNKDKSEKGEGAILTIFKKRVFKEVHLIWTAPINTEKSEYLPIAEFVKKKLEKIKGVSSVKLYKMELSNPTDHNEIYPKLVDLCKNTLPKNREYTGAIASGTPAMQVCWILMAESGDFKIKLIRSNEPKYGRELVNEIKLGTGLPRIQKLENEVKKYQKVIKDNLPIVEIDANEATVKIGDILIALKSVEFCYYRYFLSRRERGQQGIRVFGNHTDEEFNRYINLYFKKTFHRDREDSSTSFLSNISKINSAIKEALKNEMPTEYYRHYLILSDGIRGNKKYSIIVPSNKIVIKE